MSFKEIQNIQLSYNSLSDEIVLDFYIPCLSQAKIYKRAVGYFSSNILLQVSKGLGAFAENNGKMKLLVSPKLEPEDYEAIKKGYDAKEYITKKIIDDFDFNIDFDQKESRFEMLSYMISSGLLEIKIIVLKENNEIAMFHRKVGIMEDELGNQIAFSGSGNETYNGYNLNDEDFEVFCSWKSDESEQRCAIKDLEFERAWNGTDKNLITIPFPDVIKNKLLTYKTTGEKQKFTQIDSNFVNYILAKQRKPKTPEIPDNISLHDYQKSAISEWEKAGYRGIFDMATGTGKTFTGAGAICKLFSVINRLVVFVCCPFTHLVEQWNEELKLFNIEAIKCYGSVDYEKKLNRALIKFKQGRTDFVCALITNLSFKKEEIQKLVQLNLKDTLLIVDEAHNFGAFELSKTLNVNYPYRLALSATLDRYGDEIGTQKLYDFFGKKCIEYSLAEAIAQNKLTPYKYYPVVVSLTENEYDKYVEISKEIAKYHSKDGEISEGAKKLLIKRARIVAGASNKLHALYDAIKPYKDKHNILVYCGAVKYDSSEYSFSSEDEEKQIEAVLGMLNNELHIYSTKFTSSENSETRKNIISMFKNEDIQALVAIKCLDEGMNIPAIKTAFILASSTNPKEYIQRRGRVLRKFPGKAYAEIYDFITLPRQLGVTKYGQENKQIEKNLVRKELSRLIDFANLSKNPSESNVIIKKIYEAYGLDVVDEEEGDYE